MKATSLLLLVMLIASSAFAQLQSGTKFAGIGAGGSFKKPDASSKVFAYEVRPLVGYFITDNLVVGLHGGYFRSVQKQEQMLGSPGYSSHYYTENEIVMRSFNAGPMARYYYSLSNKFALFAESTTGFQSSKTKTEKFYTSYGQPGDPWGSGGGETSSTSEMKEVSLYATISPGLVFFPSTKTGIELKVNILNYLHGFDRGSHVEANLSLSKTNLGIGFYF